MKAVSKVRVPDKLAVQDLPEGALQEIASQINPETALEIWRKFGGAQLYIPNAKSLLYRLHILRHYSGSNVRELARDLDITERTVYAILSEKSEAEPNQLSLLA